MSTIYQADQYYIPFRVEQDGKIVKPEDVDGVRLSLGGVTQSWPDGGLIFRGEHWMFRLTAAHSEKLIGSVPCQVEIKRGEDRQHSRVHHVDVQRSILKGEW